MDNLPKALREDAAKIEARVSPELDARIRASLERVAAERAGKTRRRARPVSMWWASSLTGITAALLVIALINLRERAPVDAPVGTAPHRPLSALELKTETAVFIGPLEKELEDLASDLEKAERAVKEEIGLML